MYCSVHSTNNFPYSINRCMFFNIPLGKRIYTASLQYVFLSPQTFMYCTIHVTYKNDEHNIFIRRWFLHARYILSIFMYIKSAMFKLNYMFFIASYTNHHPPYRLLCTALIFNVNIVWKSKKQKRLQPHLPWYDPWQPIATTIFRQYRIIGRCTIVKY